MLLADLSAVSLPVIFMCDGIHSKPRSMPNSSILVTDALVA